MIHFHKILLSICLIFCLQIANGQNKFIEWTLQPSTKGSTTHNTVVTNGWITPFNVGDCAHNGIASVNKNTGLIHYIPVLDGIDPGIDVNDIIQTGPNEFICAGFSGKNNDVTNFFNPLIYKMDSSGNVIWKTLFNQGDIGNITTLYEFMKVVTAPDGSIYALAPNNYMGKTDANGKKLWLKPFPNASEMLWTSKGLIVATEGNHIQLLDTSGQVVKDYSFPGLIIRNLIASPSGKICTSGFGQAFLLDSNFKKTDSANFSFGFPALVNSASAIASDSAFYFYDFDSLASLNLNGKLNWKAGLPQGNFINRITYNGNQIAVTGNGPAPFIKTYGKNGNTDPIIRDIGVVNVNVKKVIMQKTSGTPDSLKMKDISANIEVTVKNFGTETIDSFYLESIGSLSWPRFGCAENLLAGFHKMNLLPGDSATVSLKINRFDITPGSNGYTLAFSVNTVSPNGKLDMEGSNDAFTFSNIMTGIKNDQISEENIHIYPNPTSGILEIDNSTIGMVINASVQNITGQELYSFKNIPNHFEMNLETLSSGIYFVKIQNENGMVVKKIVKE